MINEASWVSAHAFYHDGLDPVLVEFVVPLVDDLSAAGRCGGYFFVRYWDGGNHLRLRLLAPSAVHGEVRSVVTRRWAQFIEERPALVTMVPAEYHETAGWLSSWEGVSEYSSRLYPNNTLAFVPYRPEYERYGHGSAMCAVEQHFTESSRLALAMIAAGMSAAQRDTAALSLLLLTWLLSGVDTSNPTLHPPPSMTDVDAERRFRRAQGTIHELVTRMRGVAADPGGDGVLPAWSHSVARLRSALGEGPATLRILDTCAHLVCNRLGVTVTGEAYLRYLAARGLADRGRRRPAG